MSKRHSRAALVRSIDTQLKRIADDYNKLREPMDTNAFERACRNLSADAQNLATKAATLLAIDKELGYA